MELEDIIWKRKFAYALGISSDPEIFQIKIQEVVSELKGVERMAVDIHIYGCGDTEKIALQKYNNYLRQLFIKLKEKNVN